MGPESNFQIGLLFYVPGHELYESNVNSAQIIILVCRVKLKSFLKEKLELEDWNTKINKHINGMSKQPKKC